MGFTIITATPYYGHVETLVADNDCFDVPGAAAPAEVSTAVHHNAAAAPTLAAANVPAADTPALQDAQAAVASPDDTPAGLAGLPQCAKRKNNERHKAGIGFEGPTKCLPIEIAFQGANLVLVVLTQGNPCSGLQMEFHVNLHNHALPQIACPMVYWP